MIGDGMATNQIYAALTANKGSLNIERCPYVGFAKTYSANNYITDSAAAGTAVACGEKTENGMVGVSPDDRRLKSMLEYAADKGLSTGVAVTCELTHATPAAFIAHVRNRSSMETIAVDYTLSKVNVCIGGGRKYFENRSDGKNLTDVMKSKGFQVAYNMDEVKGITSGNLLALLADEAPEPYVIRGDMLPEAVSSAIRILNNNEKGFFLMVEGSQIDWAASSNNHAYLLDEMMDFDRTVKVALDFAEQDGNTLVVITGDHETGGLCILNGSIQTGDVKMIFASKGHTGVPVPVFTYGPGAASFSGIYENTMFLPKVLDLLDIGKDQR